MPQRADKIAMSSLRVSLLIISFSATFSAYAADFKPILALGRTYFSGTSTKSLSGATETFVSLAGESFGTRLRWTAAADFGISSGTANFSSTSTATYSMFSVGLAPGVALFPFKESSFQPYLSFKGVFGLQRFAMSSPPTDLQKSSQGFHYGYEVAIGTDLRFKKGDRGTAVRVYGSVRNLKGSVAGLSSFDLGSFRFGAGLVF